MNVFRVKRFTFILKKWNFNRMEYIALGKTNLLVSRTAFGAESLACKEIEESPEGGEEKACAIVHQAYNGGINFFDTTHDETGIECEKRLGEALHGIRQNVILATKTTAKNSHDLRMDLEASLFNLESDFIDLYQIENPENVPLLHGEDGIYDSLVELKEKGTIKHFGLCTDSFEIARFAIMSGLYEVVQFPFNLITAKTSMELVELCQKNEVGCIAMQPLNGGVVTDIPLAFGFLHQYENVVPVWGIHTQEELHEILYYNEKPPVVDENFKQEVEKLRMFFN